MASASLPVALDLGDGFAPSCLDFSISDRNASLLVNHLAHNDIHPHPHRSDSGLFDYIDLNSPFAQTPSTSSSSSHLALGNPTLSISEFDLGAADSSQQTIQSLALDPGLSFDDLGVEFGAATYTTAEPTPASTAALSTAPPSTTTPASTAANAPSSATPTAPLVSVSPATTAYSYSHSQKSHTPPVPPTISLSSISTTQQPMTTHKRPRDLSASPPPASIIDKRKRNSLAARKCRQKKLDRIEALEQALAAMTAERDELRVRMARMEGEMEGLKKARES